MKNYKKFRRIFEEIAITPEAAAEASANPENPDAAPMDPALFAQPAPVEPVQALPAPGEAHSANDAFSMTVRDFVTKCKEIDPLVCMGIESFIEKNKASLETQPAPAAPVPAQDDVTFSNVVDQPAPAAPAPAQSFSLDQSPENLNFSNF